MISSGKLLISCIVTYSLIIFFLLAIENSIPGVTIFYILSQLKRLLLGETYYKKLLRIKNLNYKYEGIDF